MKRVIIRKAGGYDRLEIEECADPIAKPGEVRVKTEAIGVNYADCIVRMGLYASAKKYVGWPITPGFEFSGVTDDGARVFGVTRFGGYATQVVVPAHQVFPIPHTFNAIEAAAFPSVFLTAYFALCELCRLRPGMRVLVHSAAGGVGSALVQLAKSEGCMVVGVVGAAHKVDEVKRLGADAVIDKSSEDLWRAAERLAPDGYHVVLDANGVSTLKDSYGHLASPGRLVIYGFHSMMSKTRGRPNYAKLAVDWVRTPRFDPLTLTNDNKSVMAFNLSYLFDEKSVLEEGMARLLELVSRHKITPPRVKTFPFDRVADAHRALESAQTTGKLVLLP